MEPGNTKRPENAANTVAPFGFDLHRGPNVASRSNSFREAVLNSYGKRRFWPMKLATAAIGLAIISIIGSSCLDIDMGIGFVLASHMQGTLVDKDMRPVPNVRVERTWDWPLNGRKGADVSVTDEKGHFEFPKVTRFSILGFVPAEPNVQLTITAHGPRGPVEIFSVIKKDYKDRSETDGRPFDIVCDVDGEPGGTASGYWGTVVEVR